MYVLHFVSSSVVIRYLHNFLFILHNFLFICTTFCSPGSCCIYDDFFGRWIPYLRIRYYNVCTLIPNKLEKYLFVSG